MIKKHSINKQEGGFEAEPADVDEELEDAELKEMGKEEVAGEAVKRSGTEDVEEIWEEEWDEEGPEVEEL